MIKNTKNKGNKEITTGCGSDLKASTNIAYALARQLAMRDLFMITMEKKHLSDKMNYLIDVEAQKIVQVYLLKILKERNLI